MLAAGMVGHELSSTIFPKTVDEVPMSMPGSRLLYLPSPLAPLGNFSYDDEQGP